jgi:hypothetical protein
MKKSLISLILFFLLSFSLSSHLYAQAIAPPFNANYSLISLGSVPGLPTNYGGLTFKADDPNTILIGGAANTAAGAIYAIGVTRGAGNHITGFTGSATFFSAGAYNDGGVAYGPGEVLFLARWPENELGQTKPGSSITDKIVDLAALGVGTGGPGGLNFVPSGFPGAGQLKIVTYNTGQWYTLAISPDGSGTYNVSSATLEATLGGGPEGIFYVPVGSPNFIGFNVLVCEYSTGAVAAYTVDSGGNPVPASRQDFITGLSGAEGAAIDPLTGDFLFSTFGGGNQVVVVQGFVPPTGTPISGTITYSGSGTGPISIAAFDGEGCGDGNYTEVWISGPGQYTMNLNPGTYYICACRDTNHNGSCSPAEGEPGSEYSGNPVIVSGEPITGINISIQGPSQRVESVPTMTEWGMIMFIVLAGFGSVYYLKRQRRS